MCGADARLYLDNSAGINLLISWLMQRILDVASGAATDSLLNITLWCVFSVVGFLLVIELYRRTKPTFIKRAMTQYKAYAFSELTRKNIGTFSKENTGTYISALTNDATSIEKNYLTNLFDLINLLVSFFGSIAMMLWYSPLLTLLSIALSLLPMAVAIITGNRLTVLEERISQKNESFVSTIKDLLSGFTVIKSFKSEAQVQKLFVRENNELEQAKRSRTMTSEGITMFSAAAMLVAELAIFLAAAYMAVSGKITAGVVIVFVQLMGLILQPVGQLPEIIANRKAAVGLIDKLVLSLSGNTHSNEGKISIQPRLSDGITLNNLSFGYEENKLVLQDINIKFEAGKSYAIVGGSGSGKSTLLQLLLGSMENYSGNIYYDGNELRIIDTDSLYELLTVVQQNVFVFNDTIRNNVTMFKEFDEDSIELAIQKSGLSQLIAEKGDSYVCGENGNALSGGEKQRISIARALLSGSPLLLMDEATAALDVATAAHVTESILDISGLTRIIVTHRLEESLLSRYDEILVMHSGKIQEKGSFAELMEQKGLFYSLYTVAQ